MSGSVLWCFRCGVYGDKKAKGLKAKILAKESWQLNNTKLGLIFESDLRKMEMEFLIQESISIKDRFSKLI